MQGIYKIYDIDTDITYIGQSKDIEERWKAHERHFKNRSDGQRDVYRLILRPEFEIIEELPDAADLDWKEEYWIEQYDSFVNGANMTLGGKWKKPESIVYTLQNRQLTPSEQERMVRLISSFETKVERNERLEKEWREQTKYGNPISFLHYGKGMERKEADVLAAQWGYRTEKRKIKY